MTSSWVLLVFIVTSLGGGPVSVGPYATEQACKDGAKRVLAELDRPLRTINTLCIEVEK